MTIAAGIERHGFDIVFVDYLQLMQRSGPDWQGLAQLSSDMQQLAANYAIPIVGASQLNRQDGVVKNMPGPEAISGSDAIGQDAAVIINIKQHTERVMQMFLAKNRHGRGGAKWWTLFTPDDGVIKEISFSRAQDTMDKDRAQSDDDEESVGGRRLRK